MIKLNEFTNSYMPAFFYMKLNFDFNDSKLVLYNLKRENRAAFIHEYIHFIQDISTYWGLNNAYVYSEYVHAAVNQIYKERNDGKFYVPIETPQNLDNVELNEYLIDECIGDYTEIDYLFITRIDVKEKKVKYKNPYFKTLQYVYIVLPSGKRIQFGARAIMESMAYLLENIISPGGNPVPEYPYFAAEYIVKHLYEDFACNPLNILALCDLSLQFSNPAKIFLQTLNLYKKQKSVPKNPEDIYKLFQLTPMFQMGQQTSLADAQLILGIQVKERLKTYLDDKAFRRFHHLIDYLIMFGVGVRMVNPTFILDIAKKGDVLYNIDFQSLLNLLGTPIINDKSDDFYVIGSLRSYNTNFQFIIAVEQIYNLLKGNSDCCELYPWCEKSRDYGTEVDDRCIGAPWKRVNDDVLCPYAVLWKKWGLSNDVPIFKDK